MQLEPLYRKLTKIPFGKQLFSRAVCFTAPYFGSIKPLVLELNGGRCRIKMAKRRAVTNHIGTVHAIAMCNLAELCAGLAIESVLAKDKRWIPKGMNVKYLKKAQSDVTGTCVLEDLNPEVGDHHLKVVVKDRRDEAVFEADITMYISEKKSS